LQKKLHTKRANFNCAFPKLHMQHLSGSCTEPFNCEHRHFCHYP